MPTVITPNTSPLSALAARKKPTPAEINALIAAMKAELKGANQLGYYQRMEQNHDARYCWWSGQSVDGRKWSKDTGRRNRTLPGEVPPEEVFPFEGASDARVRLIDTVIRERCNFMRLALQRRQERIGPRNFSPDSDPQQKAALWSQVMSYFEDITRREFRRACARWASIAQEYGHGILFPGWKSETEVITKELSIEEVATAMAQTAIGIAEAQMLDMHTEAGGNPDEAPTLTPEQSAQLVATASVALDEMRADPKQKQIFVGVLLSIDPTMPKEEAMRLAADLRFGEKAQYYAIDPKEEMPEWRALTPYIDVFYPATTESMQTAPWVAMTEWVTQAELRARIDTEDYNAAWVEAVIAHGPGRSYKLSEIVGSAYSWLLSSGSIRCGLRDTDPHENTEADAYQILHVFYRATALGNSRALYRTILHPAIADLYASHECCPYAHGRMPFFETMMEPDAAYLLASRGAGELTDTLQDNVKVQVDMRTDNASFEIAPPMLIPMTPQARVKWRPGEKIPVRTNALGMGFYTPLKTGADARASAEVQTITMDLFNEFWARGPKVDPEVKLAARQMMVSDFLEDVIAVRMMTFQLIQEFAPEELKAAFIGGLNVNLTATRADIQGMISMDIDFDIQDLSTEKTLEFVESLELVSRMDPTNLINKEPMLRALTARLLPAHYKGLIENTNVRAKQERDEEKKIVTEILSGTQTAEDERASYTPGDHRSRLAFLSEMFGVQTDPKGNVTQIQPVGQDGQPTRAQTLFQSDADVQARILNRLRFHSRQLEQQANAITGSRQVDTVTPPPSYLQPS